MTATSTTQQRMNEVRQHRRILLYFALRQQDEPYINEFHFEAYVETAVV